MLKMTTMNVYRAVISNWHKLGLKGVSEKTIMLMEDMWFDFRYRTDTAAKEESVDPAVTNASARSAVRYAPTRTRYFRKLMTKVAFPPASVFVDVGAGKGKVMMMALDYPFKRVVGIEFSPRLCKIAETNIRRYCKMTGKNDITTIHQCDVVEYVPKADENVFFLYNPFNISVMSKFLENLRTSFRQHPRSIWLIYSDPISSCRDAMEVRGEFTQVKQMHYLDQTFIVYERKGQDAGTSGGSHTTPLGVETGHDPLVRVPGAADAGASVGVRPSSAQDTEALVRAVAFHSTPDVIPKFGR